MSWETHTNYTQDEFINAVIFDKADNVLDNRSRAKAMGVKAEDVTVSPGAIIKLDDMDAIGPGCHIGLYAYLNGEVKVGENVLIGPYCSITAMNHKYDPATQSFKNGHVFKPIVIKDGSWLASGVTVTAGVTIGRTNLVCANAVVTKDTDDFAIMAGTPAKKIGEIKPETGEFIWYSRRR
jgi:acetyltransferase-like isoleucine patch superfamily enzyme